MTLTLNSPITEEQWDMIEDVDFEHTDSITFYTKHGKEVEFVKRKTGEWIAVFIEDRQMYLYHKCSCCEAKYRMSGIREFNTPPDFKYCPNCSAKMAAKGRRINL